MAGLYRGEGCDLICTLKRSLWLLITQENRIENSRAAPERPVRRLQIRDDNVLPSGLTKKWRG